MQRIIIDLYIPTDEYLALYSGAARDVMCRARDGRTVRFPGKILQRFVQHEGVKGVFCISFDRQGRFQSIERLGQ